MNCIDKIGLCFRELLTENLAIASAQIGISLTSGIVYTLKYLKLSLIESLNLLVHAKIIHQYYVFGIYGYLKVRITYKLYQSHRLIIPLNIITVSDSFDGILIIATAKDKIMGQSVVVLVSLQFTYEFFICSHLI